MLFVFRVFRSVLSVPCNLMVTRWEMVDLLALLYVIIACVIVTFT